MNFIESFLAYWALTTASVAEIWELWVVPVFVVPKKDVLLEFMDLFPQLGFLECVLGHVISKQFTGFSDKLIGPDFELLESVFRVLHQKKNSVSDFFLNVLIT